MAGNPSSRKYFIDSSIKIARLYGFQGLDLSWSWANTSWDKYNIGILFKEWRATIDLEARNNSSQSQLILTAMVAYSPLSTKAAYPVDSIRQYLNWVRVMTAGYSKPMRTNFTSAQAALYDPNSISNTKYRITQWIEDGLSADKLVVGLPFYGYAWTLVKPEDNGIGAAATGPALHDNGLVTYKEIKNHIKNYGPNVQLMYNSTYVVNYCSIGKIWFGFDDVEAVRVKVSYAKEKKLRGYYMWEVSYDHYWMLSRAAGGILNKAIEAEEKTHGDFLMLVMFLSCSFDALVGVYSQSLLGKKSGYFRGLGNGPRPTSNHGVDTSEADRLHGIIYSQQSRLDSQDVELQEQKKTIDQLESGLSQFEGMMQQFFSSQGSAFRFTDSATQ
ncbi:hypothetical protein WN943_026126 [Citrus x changshan-huyou]